MEIKKEIYKSLKKLKKLFYNTGYLIEPKMFRNLTQELTFIIRDDTFIDKSWDIIEKEDQDRLIRSIIKFAKLIINQQRKLITEYDRELNRIS